MSKKIYELSDLVTSTDRGFTINGVTAGDSAGYAVASAGDMNGDGIEDIAISAYQAGPSGSVYVVFGRKKYNYPSAIELYHLNGTNGFTVESLGYFLESGDVNGDGLSDLIIMNTNGISVVFGQKTYQKTVDSNYLDGDSGFFVDAYSVGYRIDRTLTLVSDINGDSIDDVIFYTAKDDVEDAPFEWHDRIVLGNKNYPKVLNVTSLNKSADFFVNGSKNIRDYYDPRAGDINNDGVEDFLKYSISSKQIYAIFGNPNHPKKLEQDFLEGVDGFIINGASFTSAASGSYFISDINQDGIADIVIGNNDADIFRREKAGKIHVIFGKSNQPYPAIVDLDSIDEKDGFTINGINRDDRAGWSVASVGDVNGDEKRDILIGALYASPGGSKRAGQAYVVYSSNFFLHNDSVANDPTHTTTVPFESSTTESALIDFITTEKTNTNLVPLENSTTISNFINYTSNSTANPEDIYSISDSETPLTQTTIFSDAEGSSSKSFSYGLIIGIVTGVVFASVVGLLVFRYKQKSADNEERDADVDLVSNPLYHKGSDPTKTLGEYLSGSELNDVNLVSNPLYDKESDSTQNLGEYVSGSELMPV